MKAELTIEKPQHVEATISFTFTLEQWVDVQKAMKDAPNYGPTGQIRSAIDVLAGKICRTLRYTPGDPE